MITICIPTYNRFDSVEKIIFKNHENEDVSEIILVDDFSSDDISLKLQTLNKKYYKVKYYKNDINFGPFGNKKRAVELSTNDWVFLCDSDNFADESYFNLIKKYFEWDPTTIYAPSRSSSFDYTVFAGEKFIGITGLKKLIETKIGEVFLNTGNFFFNKKEYIKIAEKVNKKYNILHTKNPYDVFVFTVEWLYSGKTIFCVPNLYYEHFISHDSVWVNHHRPFQIMYESILSDIKK
jgi:glycosyltransferase involved in cell wall biosynthesis